MIQPTSHFGFHRADALGSAATKTAPTTSSPAESSDRLSSSNSDALQAALNNTPEIRPEFVSHGRGLLVDMNFPSREIIRGLSKLFVDSADPSEQN